MPVDYEKLGLFYLGSPFDLSSGKRLAEPVLYDAKDLVTHAVVVGMTGSGKTGLGISVIEEAAIDNIPVLAIDPKGDLSNLLLTFPDLTADAFKPWVNPSDAQARGLTVDAFAEQQAATWSRGLAEWQQDGTRIARLRAAAHVQVFTPGSRAGTPLAILKSLAPPSSQDDERVAEHVHATADSLLALAGVSDADTQSREHVLVANLLQHAWGAGTTVDLPWLVQAIQRPPMDRLGVLDLETFYPSKERQALAMKLNGVLAAPGFDVWLSGEPLDIQSLLYTRDGRPRVSVISIAHLPDASRMMVVSLIFSEVLSWTRAQRGSSSLRALIYMDEIAGYLPPIANPPSKAPMLTLLKQARAAGVGLMLATQNPVDLDYKGLSNIGTWFIGKLQTERDKARLLDGLETGDVDRQSLERTLSALPGRVFLLRNVHDTESVVFQTRWTLSYLRGPLDRDDLKRLNAATPGQAESPAAVGTTARAATAPGPAASAGHQRPVLPAGVRELFLPAMTASPLYSPVLYGSARVTYADAKLGINAETDVHAITPITNGAVPVDWNQAETVTRPPDQLHAAPAADASFEALPKAATDSKQYAIWEREFERYVGQSLPLTLFTAPSLKLTSQPGESEADFRIRLQQAQREARDGRVEELRAKYEPKVARLTDRIKKAQDVLAREEQQSGQQKLQTAVSIGATILSAFMGRKSVSLSTLGRATTAVRGASRSAKEAADVSSATEKLREAEEELKQLEAQLQADIDEASAATDVAIEPRELRAKRGGVAARLVSLTWDPGR